jgi:TPP-dependent pyruvate/acetoin dehydrogenase alpha subunit
MTGGDLNERARGLGVPPVEADGLDVAAVWQAAEGAIQRARAGQGPTFLHFRCVHFEGHFLGFQLIRSTREPLKEMPEIAVPLTKSFLHPGGAGLGERLAGLKAVLSKILATLRDPRRDPANDPVKRARVALQSDQARLQQLEDQIEKDVSVALEAALAEAQR